MRSPPTDVISSNCKGLTAVLLRLNDSSSLSGGDSSESPSVISTVWTASVGANAPTAGGGGGTIRGGEGVTWGARLAVGQIWVSNFGIA